MPGPAWLILPTYNEAPNLERVVRAALPPLLAAGGPGSTLLVVDDGSPDGTGEIADALTAELEGMEVLHRSAKQGLGPAYRAGFERALRAGAELVLQMDADLSHDPADIPRLVAAADGADVVLGSRYVAGGGIEDWDAARRLLSRAGSWYARTILGLPVRDLTGGFKCIRRAVLEAIDLSSVHAHGYGFQVELTYRAACAGFRIAEVPIVFHDRAAGHSKLSAGVALEAVLLVPRMRLATLLQFV